jgi:hypothetical protein
MMNYTKIEGKDSTMEPCPVCGSKAELWRFSEDKDEPVSHVVMCSHDGAIGQRDTVVLDGCLLVMPPDDFYQPRQAQAINYWNDYAIDLNRIRISAHEPINTNDNKEVI